MPPSRRKAPVRAVSSKKPAKAPAARAAKVPSSAPRPRARGKAVPAKKAPPASARPAKKKAVPAVSSVPGKPAARAKLPAPRIAPAPVRPLMKLGKEDLPSFRWIARARGVSVHAVRTTPLDAAPGFSSVAVRDGFSSPLAPLRPDGRVATGLRGIPDASAAYEPSARRPCASCLALPCVCGALPPGVRKGSPYGQEGPAPARVTSWRRWP